MLNKSRYVRMSLTLISLLMMLTLVFAGCETDDLKAKVDDHISKTDGLESKVDDQIDKTEELDGKLDDLNGKLDGQEGKTDDLDSKLNAAIRDIEEALASAAKKATEDAAAAKTELETARAALEAQLDKLNKAQSASAADIARVDELIKTWADKLSDVEKLCKDMESSLATDAELKKALTELKDELTKAVDAAKKASVSIEAWNETTDELVDNILAELDSVYKTYADKKLTYSESGFAQIQSAYSAAYVRLMRAATVEVANGALDGFKNTAADVCSIADEIYNKLMEAGETVDDITLDDGQTLEEAKRLLNAATSIEDVDISAAVLTELNSYGEDGINLADVYSTYKNRYDYLLMQSNGAEIKKAMDGAIADIVTCNTELDGIWSQYQTWIENEANDVNAVEGFAETVASFEAAMARVEQLKAAKREADELNRDINNVAQSVTANGATIDNQRALENIKSKIDSWVSRYFATPYNAELPTDTYAGSVNYLMVKHKTYEDAKRGYDEKVKMFIEAAKNFEDALNAIPERIDLLSYDEIDAAWVAYQTWVDKASLGSFDYSLGGGKTPADYYSELLDKTVAYETLRKAALNGYDTVKLESSFKANIYNGAKIDALLAWYDTYGVKDADGKLTFENGDVDGYKLSDELTVVASDLAVAQKFKADSTLLAEKKNSEKSNIENMIAAIGAVTTNDAEDIGEAEAAYAAWLDGSNVPDGYDKSQFKIDADSSEYVIENHQTLVDARAKLTALQNEVNDIHSLIGALEAKSSYTDLASSSARDEYKGKLDAIDGAINTFKVHNGGDLEGNITESEASKLAKATLAVSKYDIVASLNTKYQNAKTVVNGTSLDETAKNEICQALADVLSYAKDGIDAVDSAVDGRSVAELAGAKLDGIADTAETYAEKFVGADDSAKDKLAISYRVSLNRIVNATTVASVEQYVGLVESELDTALSESN